MLKRIYKKVLKILFFFNPKIDNKLKLVKVGTIYGGYDIYDENLKKPTIISCGLGEDASFDIDMINKYDAKIISVDPTPRAINYFEKIKNSFGKSKETSYDESGKLEIKSYDLQKVNKNNFIFIDKAIWEETDEKLKLFFPEDTSHVSCSINFTPTNNINFLWAETISYKKICNNYNIDKVDILKLDIEGSEIAVLDEVLTEKKLPSQILVEYDIRRRNSYNNNRVLNRIHKKLKVYYFLVNINPKGDFTYVLKSQKRL